MALKEDMAKVKNKAEKEFKRLEKASSINTNETLTTLHTQNTNPVMAMAGLKLTSGLSNKSGLSGMNTSNFSGNHKRNESNPYSENAPGVIGFPLPPSTTKNSSGKKLDLGAPDLPPGGYFNQIAQRPSLVQ